jgi:hypothetical protein
VFAPAKARRRRYRVADPFIRFRFRFMLAYQADLTAGLQPEDHHERNVAPFLAEDAAATFEEVAGSGCGTAIRNTTDTVAPWWGMARHDLRRQKVRMTEEIDVVGAGRDCVTVVGECRWQSRQMGREVLADVVDYKLPALAQSGVDVSSAAILLFSKSGFRKVLREAASMRGEVAQDAQGVVFVQAPHGRGGGRCASARRR